MSPPFTECDTIQTELSAYLDGMLSEDKAQQLERHMAECAHCRAELELLREAIQTVGRMALPQPSPGMRERLLAQIKAETVVERIETIRIQRGATTILTRRIVTVPNTEMDASSATAADSATRSYVRSREQRLSEGTAFYRIIS